MTRIALISDVHLGAVPKGIHDPDAASRAAYRAFAAMQEAVLGSAPELVLLAGDLFDRADVSHRAYTAARGFLRALDTAGIPVIAISGNHDAESPLIGLLVEELPANTRWLSARHAETVTVAGVAVHGQSISSPNETRDLAAGYPDAVPGMINIGLLHTSLGGKWSRRACAPTTLDVLHARRYEMWALGHVHDRIRLSEEPLVLYPGSVHAWHPTEHGPRGFVLVDATPAGISVTHVG